MDINFLSSKFIIDSNVSLIEQNKKLKFYLEYSHIYQNKNLINYYNDILKCLTDFNFKSKDYKNVMLYFNKKDIFLLYMSWHVTRSLFINNYQKKKYIQSIHDINKNMIQHHNNLIIFLNYKKKTKIELLDHDSKFYFRIIHHCIENNEILSEKEDIFENNKIKSTTWIFPKKNVNNLDFSIVNKLNMSLIPLEKIILDEKIYLLDFHHSAMRNIYRENKYSNKKFILKNEKYIDSLNNLFFYIDCDLLRIFFEKKMEKTGIDVEELQDLEIKLIKEYKNSIKHKNVKLMQILSQELSEIYYLKLLKNILDFNLKNVKIYLPYYFDFRGRIYWDSAISPTNLKIIRHVLYYDYYSLNEINEQIIDCDSFKILKNYFHYSDIIEKKFNIEANDRIKISILWLLISLGKKIKTNYEKKIHIKEFIINGIKVIDMIENDELEKFDFDDWCEIISNYEIVKSLKNEKIKKSVISKDATASIFQFLVLVLGHKNEDFLKSCNLYDKEFWHDPYIYAIDMFLENTSSVLFNINLLKALFNRFTLKKTSLGEKYQAKRNTCWEYYKSKIKINDYTEEQKIEIKRIFDNYFNFLRENEDLLFEKNSIEIIELIIRNNYQIVLKDESVVYHDYNYLKETVINSFFEKKRKTLKLKNISDQKNERKFRNAARANFIHSLDGYYSRKVNSRLSFPIIIIHDCFLIDFLYVCELIEIANQEIKEPMYFGEINLKDKNKIYSIFILL